MRAASEREDAQYSHLLDSTATAQRRANATGTTVRAAAIDPRMEDKDMPMRQMRIEAPTKKECGDPRCIGMYIHDYGWLPDEKSIWFYKLESSLERADGAPRDMSGFYVWNVSTGKVRTIFRQPGVLDDCHVHGEAAICIEEAAKTPRRVISINLKSGKTHVLADPNPAFATKKYPRVREIVLKDDEGNIGFAQVIYPNDYISGKRYPVGRHLRRPVGVNYDGR
ncbi:hypothetical protein CAF53_02360 [Sphingobium sp. LB126]|nr:hypothetical protein CAF53_02360 [Sphingobium sp. LB126]